MKVSKKVPVYFSQVLTGNNTQTISAQAAAKRPASSSYLSGNAVIAEKLTIPNKSTTTVIDGNVYGIYERDLPSYPYALKVTLDAIPPEGDAYNIVTFKHPGGKLTIPYAVPRLTVLVLTVQEQEVARFTVQ